MAQSPRFADYDAVLHGSDVEEISSQVSDFWRWAYSDLKFNNVRGVFAEWIVAQLLNIPLTPRDGWGEFDLRTPDGVTIEVKSSAYLQSWRTNRLSSIVFSGLKGKRWDMSTNTYAAESTYNANIYIFCLQIEQDDARWDALDLDQWRFYLLKRKVLESLGTKSITLASLKKLTVELKASDIRNRGLDINVQE